VHKFIERKKEKPNVSNMVNSFRSSPTTIIDTNSTVKYLKPESMQCERESFQSNTELVGMKPIPISPCGANEDKNTRIQPSPMFDWKEGMISESRDYFHGGIVSVPSQGDSSIDDFESGQRNELDTPLDYRIDWTTQMNMIQKQLASQENNDIEMNDTFVSLGDDDASILDMSEEETFDKDEILSLSMWLKSDKESDIWVI
jgi:hypothetical protein